MSQAFTAQPREIPAEVVTELTAAEHERHRLQLREGIVADALGLACSLPLALWMGMRDLWLYGAMALLTLVSAGFKVLAARGGSGPAVGRWAYLAFLFNALAVLCFARAWGPLLVMPALLVMFAYGYASAPWPNYRLGVLVTAVAVQLAAVLLEFASAWPRSYRFEGGAMIILPRAVTHSEVSTTVCLTIFALFMLVVPLRMVGRIQTFLRDAEQRALLQSWQLRQLVPEGPRAAPPAAR